MILTMQGERGDSDRDNFRQVLLPILSYRDLLAYKILIVNAAHKKAFKPIPAGWHDLTPFITIRRT